MTLMGSGFYPLKRVVITRVEWPAPIQQVNKVLGSMRPDRSDHGVKRTAAICYVDIALDEIIDETNSPYLSFMGNSKSTLSLLRSAETFSPVLGLNASFSYCSQ